jgi:hypothetical protein
MIRLFCIFLVTLGACHYVGSIIGELHAHYQNRKAESEYGN